MKKCFLYIVLLSTCSLWAACGGSDSDDGPYDPIPDPPPVVDDQPGDPVQPAKTVSMKLFAHYMPWFVSPSASGVWNHWTMSANALRSDKSNLASHYEPLTGCYASDDEAVLDYQCLLMKYSGLDGVIIDYMGESGKNDFATIASATKKMVSATAKAGMEFAICYDEQTALGTGVFSDASEAKDQARTDMRFIQQNFMSKPNYAKNGSRPVLLMFGPARVTGSANWDYIANPLGTADVVVLNGHAANYGSPAGEFLWVKPTPDYSQAASWNLYIGGAMPGFWDVYKEFGQGSGYTTYDRENGALFERQLNAAKTAGLSWLQVTTWNDYGEGTTIEPTQQYKYQYLTILQKFSGVGCTEANLKLIYRWYCVRKARGNTADVAKAYAFLAAMKPGPAETIIKTLE